MHFAMRPLCCQHIPFSRGIFFEFRFNRDDKFIKTDLMILIPVSTSAILHIKQQHLIDYESWGNNYNSRLAVTS